MLFCLVRGGESKVRLRREGVKNEGKRGSKSSNPEYYSEGVKLAIFLHIVHVSLEVLTPSLLITL